MRGTIMSRILPPLGTFGIQKDIVGPPGAVRDNPIRVYGEEIRTISNSNPSFLFGCIICEPLGTIFLCIVSPIQAIRIKIIEWVINGIYITIPTLRSIFFATQRIDTCKPALCRRVIPRQEIIQPRLTVSFFRGELLPQAIRRAVLQRARAPAQPL